MIVLAAPSANAIVPGVLGFLVVAAMALALFFLLRSMNKQLRKVMGGPKWREDGGQPGAAGAVSAADQDGGPDGAGGGVTSSAGRP